MRKLFASSVVVLAIWASPVFGSHIFSYPSGDSSNPGSWLLQPNKSNQEVLVYVTGSEAVAGFTLDVSIGDGGNGVGGVDIGPRIESIILTGAGEVFAGGDQSAIYIPDLDGMYANTGVITLSGTVPAGGVLAKLVIDTTGFSTLGQSWALAMDYNAPTPDTNFTDAGGSKLYPAITNGMLTIVPEPSTFVLLAGIVTVLPVLVWRRIICQRDPVQPDGCCS